MNLKIEERGRVTVVLVGEDRLDHHNNKEFINELSRAIEGGSPNLVIDLQNVTFFSSGGLGALLGTLKKAKEHSGIIKLCGLQSQPRALDRVFKWESIFEIFPNTEEAVASFE